MRVRVYTDGACSGNPGPGGWAAVFTIPSGFVPIQGYNVDTTNNRMELTAVVKAMEHLSVADWARGVECVDIHSDSAYVVNAINNDWLSKWQGKRWMTQKGEAVKNKDLWQKLIDAKHSLERDGVRVTMVKVKGHAGNTFNEMVDKLAVEQSMQAQAAISGR